MLLDLSRVVDEIQENFEVKEILHQSEVHQRKFDFLRLYFHISADSLSFPNGSLGTFDSEFDVYIGVLFTITFW